MTARSAAGKEELLKELRAHGLTDMAEKAEAGEYSDFASPHAFPLMTLVAELRAAGHEGLAQRAMEGDFDHDL
jgi:hypothetical protein